jgi:hypothetical protein
MLKIPGSINPVGNRQQGLKLIFIKLNFPRSSHKGIDTDPDKAKNQEDIRHSNVEKARDSRSVLLREGYLCQTKSFMVMPPSTFLTESGQW